MKKSNIKRLLAVVLSSMLLVGGVYMSGCTNNGGSSGLTEADLREVISNERLVSGTPVTLENSPVYQNQAIEVAAPENVLDRHETGVTDETLTVTRDERYGGGQFISKLFTEGLSRAANGQEFSTFQQYIVENGCNVETLKTLAKAVFESEAFQSFEMNRVELAFCLYRALLSRDPSEEEIMAVILNEVSEKIDEIMNGEEFVGLLEDIAFGPYSWRGTNDTMWTGDVIYTMSEFSELLKESDNALVLPQGALILVDSSYTLPVGCSISTEGNPDHYVRFARFLRTEAGVNTMNVVSNTVLQNIFTDGNRGELTNSTAFGMSITGRDNVVWGCRLGESTAPIHTHPGASNMYCGRNLVTQYGTNHWGTGGWADGIDMYSYRSVVEYNNVVDATDAGIVIFRAQEAGQNVPQNSIVRYNTICNTGNSAYCGIDNEGVDMIGSEVADFTGVVIYGNALYTSYVAHMHMCITLSARPWTENYKKVSGVSFYNNYTPAGCFVNTGGGIIAEGANNGTVRGNQFEFHLADWTGNFMGERHYSVNSTSCDGGDFQSGYLDISATNFISPVMDIEKDISYEVKFAYVYEDFQTIPASKFSWT